MKIDLSNMVIMYFAISFLLSMFLITTYYVRSKFKNFSQVIVKHCSFIILEFLKKLEIKDYIAFEKYGVWRYSGRF